VLTSRLFCLVAILKVENKKLELELDYVSQKQNEFNTKIHWYNILLTFMCKFTAGLLWTKICVLSNLSN